MNLKVPVDWVFKGLGAKLVSLQGSKLIKLP
jgi:hypothetical protein